MKAVTIFLGGFLYTTVAHETFHAMGLYHSFSNKGEFIFKKFKTDNIMDYSDIDSDKTPIISTWQWSIIQKNIDKE